MHITRDRILTGRDRISEVLNTYVSPNDALERANNIAQALVDGACDPKRVALEMLKHLDITDRLSVAAQVGEAWSAHTGR